MRQVFDQELYRKGTTIRNEHRIRWFQQNIFVAHLQFFQFKRMSALQEYGTVSKEQSNSRHSLRDPDTRILQVL